MAKKKSSTKKIVSSLKIYVGVAGWNLPTVHKHLFPDEGSHLEKYVSKYNCVEINSSFHKLHKAATFERWAATVPADFKFSVKLSKEITHKSKLQSSSQVIADTVGPIMQLKEKLGALLIQLPPKLDFNEELASDFFEQLRGIYDGPIAFEPRHISWASRDAKELIEKYNISKVKADPEPCPGSFPETNLIYYRLHGSPKKYYSSYGTKFLKTLSEELKTYKNNEVWCIFDNTAQYHGTVNALKLQSLIKTI